MDTGLEYKSISSEHDESEYQPNPSEAKKSDHEPRRTAETNKHTEIHQGPATLNKHHLRAHTDVEMETVISIEDTLKVYDGSSLDISRFRRPTTMVHALTSIGYSIGWRTNRMRGL